MKREDITKLFPDATKEQIDQIMTLNGADINAAKSGVDQLRTQHADELKKEKDLADGLQKQVDDLKAASTLRDLKDKVAKESGVPANLLTGSTEEEFKAQADAIKAYAGQQNGYPTVKDGGETTPPAPKESTRDQFANWFNEHTK